MERADFAAWCAAVCRHIRYRPARAQAAAELMDHLTDHAAALEDAGTAPEEAARTALAAMGDAGEVGRALDRAHPPLLCASVALTRACAVLLSVAACLFLLPLLFLSAWDLLIYRPVRSIPREEIVRAAAGDTAARIGNKVVVVTDVVQTRDGTLSVCLLEFNVPPILNSFGFYGFQVRDESGRIYRGGGQSSGSYFRRSIDSYQDFPPTDSVTLLYDEPGRACQLTIPLEEVTP